MTIRTVILLGAMSTAAAGRALAQSSGLDPERDLPVWMRSWSPLVAAADLPRQLPGAGTSAMPSLFGPPRVGPFWTAGNPAGLVGDLSDSRSDFILTRSRQTGDYRRPLDPGATTLTQ